MSKKDKLYDYIFHFNIYKGLWAAVPRSEQKEYFNDMSGRVNKGVLYAKDYTTLVEFLSK